MVVEGFEVNSGMAVAYAAVADSIAVVAHLEKVQR